MTTTGKKFKAKGGELLWDDENGKIPGNDESDEERELTNLNWLLCNQNLTWANTIDENPEIDIITHIAVPDVLNMANNHSIMDKNNIKHSLSNLATLKSPSIDYTPQNLLSCSDSKPTYNSKRLSPSERYDIFVNKIKRDLTEYQKFANKYNTDVTEKPPFNYSHIIGMAILENGRVTLQQICAWIESKFAFFRVRKKWNNSIRHNLSLHHCFRNRKREEKGKGGYWELGVDPKKSYRKRIRNRKATTHVNYDQNRKSAKDLISTSKNHKNTSKNSATQNNILLNKNPIQICCQSYSQLANDIFGNEQDVQIYSENQSFSLTEVEIDLELSLPNNVPNFLCPDDSPSVIGTNNDEEFHVEEQYELGTIIISTSEDSSCLSNIISKKYGCANSMCAENDLLTHNENIILSSHLSTVLTSAAPKKIDSNKGVQFTSVSQIVHPTFEIPSGLTINYDIPNFHAYTDRVDKSLDYLHFTDINSNADILDNILDMCVKEY